MEIVVLDKVNTLAVPVSSLLDTVDWASGPLGPKSEWPACLHAAIGIMLPSHAQIVMFWGPEFVAFYNDAYAPTIGNKHPHAFGRPAREYWNELWDDLEPLLQRVLAKGETVAAKDRPFYIERHGYPETVYFDISYSPVADQDGTVRGVFCIVNETTERVKADAALRESEERLRAIFAQSAAGIALGDLTGKLLSVNDHFCRIVGRPRDELIGIRMQEITFADDLPENQRLFQHMVQTGESFEIEKRYVRGDGSLVWVANSVDGTVTRIDPGSATVTGTYPVGHEPIGLAFLGTSLWVVTSDATLERIDPGTGAPIGSYPLPSRPASVLGHGRSLFVTSTIANEVWQVDAATGQVVARVATGNGAVGAALESQDAWCGIIVDGRHVDPATLLIALRTRPLDRFMLVTDAMPTVGMADKRFTLQGQAITVQDGVCVGPGGTLAGSDLDMIGAVRNAVDMLGMSLENAVTMASSAPAACLGLAAQRGTIAPGMAADLVLLDEGRNVVRSWIDGRG